MTLRSFNYIWRYNLNMRAFCDAPMFAGELLEDGHRRCVLGHLLSPGLWTGTVQTSPLLPTGKSRFEG